MWKTDEIQIVTGFFGRRTNLHDKKVPKKRNKKERKKRNTFFTAL